MTDKMDAFLVVIGLVVFFLMLPCKYDPLILWKERLEDWPKHKRRK